MDQFIYRNFDLVLERTAEAEALGVRVRVQDSPGGVSSWVAFALPFTAAELAAAVAATWRTDRAPAYRLAGVQPVTLDPQDFGQRFFSAVLVKSRKDSVTSLPFSSRYSTRSARMRAPTPST